MSADVAIIIVTYNSARQIEACLRSVFQECHRNKQEVIVLDNKSTDETLAIIQKYFPAVKLIVSESNLGFAAGVNAAARHATADFILLLNPDTVIQKRSVDIIVEFARRNPRYGLYGCRTLKTDGSLEPSSCWGLPSLWSLAMFAVGLSTVAKRNRFFDPESLGNWPRDTVKEVGVITGCFLLISRSLWENLKGFDERFFMYGEDVDLAIRAQRAGYRPVICPEAQITHEIGQSAPTPAHKMLQLYRGKVTILRTHWTGISLNFGLALLLAGVALRTFAGSRSRRRAQPLQPSIWMALWRERKDWLEGYPINKTRVSHAR